MPMPHIIVWIILFSLRTSVRNPHTFLLSIYISFGHLMPAAKLNDFSMACAMAREMNKLNLMISLRLIWGFNTADIYKPELFGDIHSLLNRPLPSVCSFDTTMNG